MGSGMARESTDEYYMRCFDLPLTSVVFYWRGDMELCTRTRLEKKRRSVCQGNIDFQTIRLLTMVIKQLIFNNIKQLIFKW